MPDLSICMPSHRNLENSRRSIESAVAYCEARDAVLIVSDNSGDAQKQAVLKDLSPRLVLVDSGNASAIENMERALDAVRTTFVMPMGDDDEIRFDASLPTFDLASLGYDYIGVTPVSVPFTTRHGDMPAKGFALDSNDPGERMSAYMAKAQGNNSLYYSMYRRDVFVSLVHAFTQHHPTKGSYCDWALSQALVSYGKMAHDPGTTFRYNMDKWDSAGKIAEMYQALYTGVGLPVGSEKFENLLMYLDVFILATRPGTPLPQDQRQKLALSINSRLLGPFIKQVANNPDNFDGTVRHLSSMVLEEQDSFGQFQIALLMADKVQPGLKDRYVEFLKAVMTPG